jgi:hypothetical protein
MWLLMGFLGGAVVLLGVVVATFWARKKRRRDAAVSTAALSTTPMRETYQNPTYEEIGGGLAANRDSVPPVYQEVMKSPSAVAASRYDTAGNGSSTGANRTEQAATPPPKRRAS